MTRLIVKRELICQTLCQSPEGWCLQDPRRPSTIVIFNINWASDPLVELFMDPDANASSQEIWIRLVWGKAWDAMF